MSRILVITGPSGSGKSTVIEYLLEKPLFKLSISYTTRGPRFGEENGKDYIFISKEEFESKIKLGFFLEYTEYCGNYYGTPIESLDTGIILILDVNQEGLEFFREKHKRSFFCLVHIKKEVLEKRLRERMISDAQYTEDKFQERMDKYDLYDGLKDKFTFNMIINNSKDLKHLKQKTEELAENVINFYELEKLF